MAKGNLFQGMARGKVGDVVFSRLNGQQVSRVRNRNPKNPRTNAQLYQRAIMATVMQAYAAGKEIFDHSFQGYSKGAQNQQQFISRNAKLLRSLVAADLKKTDDPVNWPARLVAPGVQYPNPFEGMIISRGTYDQNLFTFIKDQSQGEIAWKMQPVGTATTLGEYCIANNIIANDIYTIVLLAIDLENPVFALQGVDAETAKEYASSFGFIRMRVKESALTSDKAIAEATYADLFTIEKTTLPTDEISAERVSGSFNIAELMPDTAPIGTVGIIRSRLDEDLRSNSVMYFSDFQNPTGLSAKYVLDAWKQGTEQVGDSELILEGGNF